MFAVADRRSRTFRRQLEPPALGAVRRELAAEHPEGVAQLATFKALHARAQEGEVLELCERVVGNEVVGA